MLELFPVVVSKEKSCVDPFTGNESKPSRIVVERSEIMLILIHIIASVDVLTVLLLSPAR